jgi:hypothetical protein
MLITYLRDPKSGWNSKSGFKFKVFSFCKVSPLSLVGNFSKLIGMELVHTPKREIIPDDIFYKPTNLQKI